MKQYALILLSLLLFACQSAEKETLNPSKTEQQNGSEKNNSTGNTNISAYDLPSFSCKIEGKEWIPDLAFARIYYNAKKEVDSLQIKASRISDASEMKISIFLFKGTGTYALANDKVTGKGIGMAEFRIEEEGSLKSFFSTGGKITIGHFDDAKGIMSGTIDEIPFFHKGHGMVPDVREVREGIFNGTRIEQ